MSYKYLDQIINNNFNDNKDIEQQQRDFSGKNKHVVKNIWFMFICCKASVIHFILWFDVHNISFVWLHKKAIPTIEGSL